jgi:hypothetical protein
MYEKWQAKFWEIVKEPDSANALKEAAINERLGDWTEILTAAVVRTCESVGWQASARGHKFNLLPVRRSEYLGLDVMAFTNGDKKWRFPTAIVELENSQDVNQIAYSLWKVLCVRAGLRMVFCYCRNPEDRSSLVSLLSQQVISALDLSVRAQLKGETLVVVGSRAASATFPYGFFKWWRLDKNTGELRVI